MFSIYPPKFYFYYIFGIINQFSIHWTQFQRPTALTTEVTNLFVKTFIFDKNCQKPPGHLGLCEKKLKIFVSLFKNVFFSPLMHQFFTIPPRPLIDWLTRLMVHSIALVVLYKHVKYQQDQFIRLWIISKFYGVTKMRPFCHFFGL